MPGKLGPSAHLQYPRTTTQWPFRFSYLGAIQTFLPRGGSFQAPDTHTQRDDFQVQRPPTQTCRFDGLTTTRSFFTAGGAWVTRTVTAALGGLTRTVVAQAVSGIVAKSMAEIAAAKVHEVNGVLERRWPPQPAFGLQESALPAGFELSDGF